jgi:hypothetical protein
MTLRTLFAAALVLITLSAIWAKRQVIQEWLKPPAPSTAKPIQFDNGTVREYGTTAERSASSGSSPVPAGTMRKCFKGQQISYTNQACPPGYNEKAVAGPPINVLPGQAPAKPAAGQPPGKTNSSLRDALDLSRGDDNLRERAMERTIEGKRP